MTGYIYLIHFARPISPRHTCQHYIGWAENLAQRIKIQRAGGPKAARLCQVANQRQNPAFLVRAWRGTRDDERRLKNLKGAPRLCPWCSNTPSRPGGLTEIEPGIDKD